MPIHSNCMMNKIIYTLLLSTFLSTASAKDEYVSLFNGIDLRGWVTVGTSNAFEVKKHSIYTNGASPYPSWLRTEQEYENFILRFEYQTEGWYEGGVLIHAPIDGPPSKLGLKLHLRHDQKEYGKRSPGAVYDAATPVSIVNKPSGEWNQCEIVCDWPTLRITLNGTIIHDIQMDQNESLRHRLRSGYIGIQNLGCRSYFRNIEVKELPAKEQSVSLFQYGLSGLIPHKETKWIIDDDTLIGQDHDGFISTKEKFTGPIELQVWVKTIVNGNGGVHFNWIGNGVGIEVQVFNTPDSTNTTGSFYNIASASKISSIDKEWFFMQVFSDGPHAMVMVNGEIVCKTNQIPPPHTGSFAFQQHTPGATIYYRDAKVIKRSWRIHKD